jgi:DNA-binding NtrC family response regulator
MAPHQKTILVADDDQRIFTEIARLLETHGYKVVHAENGPPVLAQLDRYNIALVLLDIPVPDHEGFKILREVRARHPDLPVLVMSEGYWVEYDELAIAKKYGANATFSKPLSSRLLLKLVDRELAVTGGVSPS